MRAVWTPLGLKSLDKTTNFIEELWNEEVANNFLERLDHRIEQLKKNPRMGSLRTDRISTTANPSSGNAILRT